MSQLLTVPERTPPRQASSSPSKSYTLPLQLNGQFESEIELLGTYKDICALLFLFDSPSKQYRITEYLQLSDIKDIHRRDSYERSIRYNLGSIFANRRSDPDSLLLPEMAIFGAPLHNALLCSSTNFSVGDKIYEIPIIVHACAKVLLNIKQLTEGRVNTNRIHALVNLYNNSSTFGEGYNLSQESSEDVVSLLSTYLLGLPEPLVPLSIVNGLLNWCVISDSGSNPRSDRSRVSIAAALLKLLPRANFSLIVYLLHFFRHVPDQKRTAAMDELSPLNFARKLLGGTERESVLVLSWFLLNWDHIQESLFPGSVFRGSSACGLSLPHLPRASHEDQVEQVPELPHTIPRMDIPTIVIHSCA